jgi:hypothetical protein
MSVVVVVHAVLRVLTRALQRQMAPDQNRLGRDASLRDRQIQGVRVDFCGQNLRSCGKRHEIQLRGSWYHLLSGCQQNLTRSGRASNLPDDSMRQAFPQTGTTLVKLLRKHSIGISLLLVPASSDCGLPEPLVVA